MRRSEIKERIEELEQAIHEEQKLIRYYAGYPQLAGASQVAKDSIKDYQREIDELVGELEKHKKNLE